MTQNQYEAAVASIKEDIARGWVYQANLCRMISVTLDEPLDGFAFWQTLCLHNPAPHAGYLFIPEHDGQSRVEIMCASPELFLQRDGNSLMSSPIKGTAATQELLLDKDTSENIMIVDLVRNDMSHIAVAGSVRVQDLLRVEEHPGLVHLVSDVIGQLPTQTSWSEILKAMTPPGSVSGAPKISALEVISRLEPNSRGIYCGAFGWVDADRSQASLAVGIRTFWQTVSEGRATLHFGTGAGITWGSEPRNEWNETELKANHLLNIAAHIAK
jgi:para-aminobenzoate synthetase component 1